MEAPQRRWTGLWKGAICKPGNGFKDTGQRGYQPREKGLMGILLMKPRLRLTLNAYGFGLQLNKTQGNSWD
jgi:hypothetical protein